MKTLSCEFKARLGWLASVSARMTGVCALSLGLYVAASAAHASEGAFINTLSAMPAPSGAQELCQQYRWACSTKRSINLSSQEEMKLVQQINRKVNASTREVTDQSQYKTPELWALPTARGGDCEDFALLKKRDLISAGIDPKRLLIATVLDTRRNSHAVLVYRSAQGDLVLDNLTNRIKSWSDTRYLFLRMQDPKRPHRWVGVFGRS